jgi:hypothetical protein
MPWVTIGAPTYSRPTRSAGRAEPSGLGSGLAGTRTTGVGQPAGGVAVPGLGAGDRWAIADDADGLGDAGVDEAAVGVVFGAVGPPAVDPQAATMMATVASRAR